MVNQIVKESEKLSPVVQAIFRWRSGDESHCLLRIFREQDSAIIMASGLHSNKQMDYDVSTDFEALALAVQAQYPTYLDPLNTQSVTWLSHYGTFSAAHSFENLTIPERFSRVTLPWPLPEKLEPWSAKWWVLRPPEVDELIHKIQLSPVPEIVGTLNSDI